MTNAERLAEEQRLQKPEEAGLSKDLKTPAVNGGLSHLKESPNFPNIMGELVKNLSISRKFYLTHLIIFVLWLFFFIMLIFVQFFTYL